MQSSCFQHVAEQVVLRRASVWMDPLTLRLTYFWLLNSVWAYDAISDYHQFSFSWGIGCLGKNKCEWKTPSGRD